MGPEDAVESLHGDGEDGGAGAGERDLSKGQQPRDQAGVNLGGGNSEQFYLIFIDMFVSTNYPGVCLGQSITLSVCHQFFVPNESENFLVSSM